MEKEQAKLRVSRREEIKKIKTKVNEIEMKKMIEKISETKSDSFRR